MEWSSSRGTGSGADEHKRTDTSESSFEVITEANDLDFSALGNNTTLNLRWMLLTDT